MLGVGPDGTAAGCGWARNAKFVQRPYEAGDGPARPGWSGAAPDSAAGRCGGTRNANFVQGPYEAGRGRGGVPSCRLRLPGAFSPNRAATLCNRQVDAADGWGAVVPAEAPMVRFRQIAQRPYATVRRPRRADGARVVSAVAVHGAVRTNCAATLCNRQGADSAGWGAGRVGGGGPRRRSDKSRNNLMQLSGGRCGRAGRGSCRRRGTTAPFGQIVHRPLQRGAGGSVSGWVAAPSRSP